MRWWFRKSGFSLIELSLILVVLSFIAVTLLTKKAQDIEVKRQLYTTDEIGSLKASLQTYKNTFNRYPCPASPSAAIRSAGFGWADCDGADIETSDDGKVVIGAVPWKDLNSGPNSVFDNWGNRIMYAVTFSATSAPGNGSDVKILSNYDETFVGAPDETNTKFFFSPFALISYGRDGIGAYPRDGGANRIQAVSSGGPSFHDSELQNSNHHLYKSGSLLAGQFDGVFVKPGERFTEAKMKATPAPDDEYAFLQFDDVVDFVGTEGGGCPTDPKEECYDSNNECAWVESDGCCLNGKVWDSGSCQCQGGRYWDPTANGGAGSCVCPAGSNFNTASKTCVQCTSTGGSWDGVSNCTCTGINVWNGLTCSCPPGTTPSGNTCVCPSGWGWNSAVNTCYNCTHGTWNTSTNTCTCYSNPANYNWSASTGCTLKSGICAQGQNCSGCTCGCGSCKSTTWSSKKAGGGGCYGYGGPVCSSATTPTWCHPATPQTLPACSP